MNFALVGPAASLWQRLRDSGQMQAAIEEEGLSNPTLTFDDFDVALLAGMKANIIFASRLGAAQNKAMLVAVEEGHFEVARHTGPLLNGDETTFGVTLPAHGQTPKVKVRAY